MAKDTENKAKKHRKSRLFAYILTALAVFSALAAGGIYAKYAIGARTDGYVSSPDFYFTSDLLTETAAEFTLNPGESGTAEISFSVRNFADELRVSDKDINFNVTVSPADGVAVKVDGNSANSGTLAAAAAASANVTVSGLKNGETYSISVTGKAGFSTTLRANVTVRPDETEIFKHIDDNDADYVLLTVWTQNISGKVSITVPKGLIPDKTDSIMKDVANLSEGKYAAVTFMDTVSFTEGYSSHVYRFFKTPDYEAEDFTVALNDKEAILATPE